MKMAKFKDYILNDRSKQMIAKMYLTIFILFLFFLAGCEKTEIKELGTETMGEFAPEDAFLEGEEHPYYGSENEWNQRFFVFQGLKTGNEKK